MPQCEAYACEVKEDLESRPVEGPFGKELAYPRVKVVILLCKVHRYHMDGGYPILLQFRDAT